MVGTADKHLIADGAKPVIALKKDWRHIYTQNMCFTVFSILSAI
jgi:hypothetical protein